MSSEANHKRFSLRGKIVAHLSTTSLIFVVLTLALAVLLVLLNSALGRCHRQMDDSARQYVQAVRAVNSFESGTRRLNANARSFVVTGDAIFVERYFKEANMEQRRERGLAMLENALGSRDSDSFTALSKGLTASNQLADLEHHAMRLTQLAQGWSDIAMPQTISSYQLSDEELSLDAAAMEARAEDLVFGEAYCTQADEVESSIETCLTKLNDESTRQSSQLSTQMSRLQRAQVVLLALIVGAIIVEVAFVITQIRVPLSRMDRLVRSKLPIEPIGAAELRLLTQAYNEALEENERTRSQLTHEATHDALTGLLNRHAYEALMDELGEGRYALILFDIDRFKEVNDTNGHDVGDAVLKRVSETLRGDFRSIDAICRLGGDEFAVVMSGVDSSMEELVSAKIAQVNEELAEEREGVPGVRLSAGAAFSDQADKDDELFRRADSALYQAKATGRENASPCDGGAGA